VVVKASSSITHSSTATLRLRPPSTCYVSSYTSKNGLVKRSSCAPSSTIASKAPTTVGLSTTLCRVNYTMNMSRAFSSVPDWKTKQEAEDNEPKQASASIVHSQQSSDNENAHKLGGKYTRLSQVPISEILKAKHTLRWVEPVICHTSTVKTAIQTCIEGNLSGMMVVDRDETTSESSRERGRVVGMTTSRDLLRMMAAGFKNNEGAEEVMNKTVGNFMTPISQVIYARPEETVGTCRAIMAKLGIKCLPVLSHGRVEGLVTARDMSDYGVEAKDRGGKKNYLRDISERVGLSSNTSMAEPPTYLRAHLALEQKPLFMNVGVAEMPHPFKTGGGGCGMNARDFGPRDLTTDPDMSEDAYFVMETEMVDNNEGSGSEDEDVVVTKRPVVYMGVADGVGSWREYGVDPREFSHRLMEECENLLREATNKSRVITPSTVLANAFERVKEENIIGSSTACVGLFDSVRHQLHFSNLGDSGIIVLRHIDSNVAGALKRDRKTPRVQRKSDIRIAFVSQQQLKSFNHPFQLGWTGEDIAESDGSSFKTAADSCASSIHVRRGDIILMATDGLFDNVDIDDIAEIALEWEQRNGFIRGGDISAREKRWAAGASMTDLSCEKVTELAEMLCIKARENSLDNSVDSPFAILAKENDIMWSGGMPDDCTVIAMHIVGEPAHKSIL